MRKQNRIILLLAGSYCLLVAATFATAEDLHRGYDRMLSESRTYQTKFSERTRILCQEIKTDCEKSTLQGDEVYLGSTVPLYSRNGYRIEKADVLPARTPFILQGRLKGYYKIITTERKKYLLSLTDFTTHYSSPCQASYQHCLKGRE